MMLDRMQSREQHGTLVRIAGEINMFEFVLDLIGEIRFGAMLEF